MPGPNTWRPGPPPQAVAPAPQLTELRDTWDGGRGLCDSEPGLRGERRNINILPSLIWIRPGPVDPLAVLPHIRAGRRATSTSYPCVTVWAPRDTHQPAHTTGAYRTRAIISHFLRPGVQAL